MDSLDTVELITAFEKDGGELSEIESEQLRNYICEPILFMWLPPDSRNSWPDQILVFGRYIEKVLFYVRQEGKYGVGYLSQSGRVENVEVYACLSRALFAFQDR